MDSIKPFRLQMQPWIHVVMTASTLASAIASKTNVQSLYVEYVMLPSPTRCLLWIYVLPPLATDNELIARSTIQLNENTLWDGRQFAEPRYYLTVDRWLQSHSTAVTSQLDRMVLRADPIYFVHISHLREQPLPSFEDWSTAVLQYKQGDLMQWIVSYAHAIAPLMRQMPTHALVKSMYDQHWRADCQTSIQSDQRAVLQYLTLVVAIKHRVTLFGNNNNNATTFKDTLSCFEERFTDVARYILMCDLQQLVDTGTGNADLESVLLTLRLNGIPWNHVLDDDALKPYDECIRILTQSAATFWLHLSTRLEQTFGDSNMNNANNIERAIVNALMMSNPASLEVVVPNVDDIGGSTIVDKK